MDKREPLMDRALEKREWALVEQRRKEADKTYEPPEKPGETAPRDRIGLALSGGGIRSATFCLGVLQALAKQGFLSRLDYLSTVSGGGYIGGFLGAWLRNSHVTEVQKNLAEAATTSGKPSSGTPPVREPDSPSGLKTDPLKYLRENGRYLAPNGAGDMGRNVASQLRNFLSMHVVFGSVVLALFLLFNLAALAVHACGLGIFSHEMSANLADLSGLSDEALSLLAPIQWSQAWVLAAAVLGFGTGPLILAYWFAEAGRGRLLGLWLLGLGTGAAALILGWMIVQHLFQWQLLNELGEKGEGTLLWLSFLFASSLVALGLIAWACAMSTDEESAAKARNRLNTGLADSLVLLLLAGGYWVVDTIACTFANLIVNGGLRQYLWAIVSVLVFPLLSTLFREQLPKLGSLARAGSQKSSGGTKAASPSWYGQMLLWAAAGAAGLLYLSSFAVAAKLLVSSSYGWADSFGWGLLLTSVVALGAWMLGSEFGFVNYASMQTTYAQRLSRAYLGASNPDRHGLSSNAKGAPQRQWNVTSQVKSDIIEFIDYKPHKKGGPLHLLNVTINETVSGHSALEQQDRKGFLLCAGPAGLSAQSADGTRFVWDEQELPTGGGLKYYSCRVEGKGTHPLLSGPEDVEKLQLGEWMAISGAAVSTGCGFHTSKALSLLLGLFDIRLGYWWNSGIDPRKAFDRASRGAAAQAGDALAGIFRNQAALFDEFSARFHGAARRRWFLSDGGHFENTACYELLRRQVPLILCCDCGEDQEYAFGDFVGLMRKARIDLGAEFEFLEPKDLRDYLPLEAIGTLDELRPDEKGFAKKPASVVRVHYRDGNTSILVLLKPTLTPGTPLDVLDYRDGHPSFPQETTADQFFDEAQWESYRKLGQETGTRLFESHLHADFLEDALDLWRHSQPDRKAPLDEARIDPTVEARRETPAQQS